MTTAKPLVAVRLTVSQQHVHWEVELLRTGRGMHNKLATSLQLSGV
jgi:hypothetical protein